MTEAQIRDALKKVGNPVGAEFSQRKGTSLAPLKKVDQGMCKGLTLDWIRRVLTGGKGASAGNPFVLDDSNAAKGIASTNAAKNLNQYKKGAYFQLTTNKNSMDAFYVYIKKVQNDQFYEKQEQVNQYIQGLADTAVDQNDYDAKVLAIKAAFDKWQTYTHKPSVTAENRLKMFWQDYCSSSNIGKHQSHRLSNLTVVASSTTKKYIGGLVEFLPIAIKAVGENQAASVGISPPIMNESGHAIGIHRLNTGKYHLFEPNFGVYDMTQAGLFKALLFLFAKAYPDSEGIEGDGHAYQVNGVVEGDYVIFARN
jgi:hypothetical protein